MKENFINKIVLKTALFFVLFFSLTVNVLSGNTQQFKQNSSDSLTNILINIESKVAIKNAKKFLKTKSYTVTRDNSSNSIGGIHDYFSEGPYWWPDSLNINGAYVRNDGIRNPDRFLEHHNSLRNFATIVSSLSSAYLLNGEEKYAKAAIKHLYAWFINDSTKMNPNMLYAQSIKGISSGRGIGIIDAVALIDVAQAITILEESPSFSKEDIVKIKDWYSQFLNWLTTHQYGIDEMNTKNNHSTWYHAQVAAYANLIGNRELLNKCWIFYKDVFLHKQMSLNGAFQEELKRTNPFSYSIYNLEAMSYLAYFLNKNSYDSFNYQLKDGRGLAQGLNFIEPYIKDISTWPYKKDVSNWDSHPNDRQFMLFYALNQNNKEWFELWKSLRLQSVNTNKNKSKTNPLLWINKSFFTKNEVKNSKDENTKLKVILKLDDLAVKGGILKCSNTLDYLINKNIKASLGIIPGRCDSTVSHILKPYLNATNSEGEKIFEIWHHGLVHERNEFDGADYISQKKNFDDADLLVKKLLGVQMTSFGAPYNKSDSITNKVVSENSSYKIFMFSSAVPKEDNNLLYINNRVNIETETGNPVFDFFKENYLKSKEKYTDYIILQGHPNLWTDDKLLEFNKIIDFLISEGCEFSTPYDIYSQRTTK